MEGKISEIIDNVLDTDDYLNNNKQENINSINSWTQLTYLDKDLFKKDKLPSPIDDEKGKESKNENINNLISNNSNNNNNEINFINDKKEKKEKKILNENLFKGKGFRTNMDFFLKNNSETLSLSGINDISSLAEYPNVFTCIQPRPGTNRYKKANKSKNNSFYNSFYSTNSNNKFGEINNLNISTQSSMNKKNLPKIKNQIEERKNPVNKVIISAKNK